MPLLQQKGSRQMKDLKRGVSVQLTLLKFLTTYFQHAQTETSSTKKFWLEFDLCLGKQEVDMETIISNFYKASLTKIDSTFVCKD